jgi:copper(I)-binding protein
MGGPNRNTQTKDKSPMPRTLLSTLVFALTLSAAVPALADEFKAGDVTIDNAWSRATPKGADSGVAYFAIHNNGATPDRLTGGSAEIGAVEIHEMKSEDGVMKMRELKDGLNVPAHATIRFTPGGYHLMFTHLTKPLNKGDSLSATLTFEHAGPVTVTFPVEALGAAGPAPKGGDTGSMKGMKM